MCMSYVNGKVSASNCSQYNLRFVCVLSKLSILTSSFSNLLGLVQVPSEDYRQVIQTRGVCKTREGTN